MTDQEMGREGNQLAPSELCGEKSVLCWAGLCRSLAVLLQADDSPLCSREPEQRLQTVFTKDHFDYISHSLFLQNTPMNSWPHHVEMYNTPWVSENFESS